ncbi:MAG: hypothetical protein PVF58_12010 [Candidatus Methanofastidiosia archaeon]
MIYDFDVNVQKIIQELYSHILVSDWRKWLSISSPEEYMDTVFKISGLSSADFDTIKTKVTNPKEFSVDVNSFAAKQDTPAVFCHTSGTSGGTISDIKWFYMSEELVSRLWAPGMKAIFESSGLHHGSLAVIFVPSRAQGDGLSYVGDTPVVRLYSAEFSQRLVLSLVNPHYLMYEYKDSRNISVLARMLSMDKISVISAPFLTVLGWADTSKLAKGIKKSLHTKDSNPDVIQLKERIHSVGIDTAAKKIRDELSFLLSEATLIFSSTAMTKKEWGIVSEFLQWEPGDNRFTNLYVGSEVGPFAANIGNKNVTENKNDMYVFPLCAPVLEHKGNRGLLPECGYNTGKLLVSRLHNGVPVINIDSGDVITVKNRDGLPVIHGEILRAGFPLKTKVNLSGVITKDEPKTVYVGTYFDLDTIKIRNPRLIVRCLAEQCNFSKRSSLVLEKKGHIWHMVTPDLGVCSLPDMKERLSVCPGGESLGAALKENTVDISTVDENPVQSVVPRSELLEKVRKGELPKGILKKWPVYVVVPKDSKITFV